MISEKVKQGAGENRNECEFLREGGREFHKWIVEWKNDFENEEARQKKSRKLLQ